MVPNKGTGPLCQLYFCAVPTLLCPVVQAQAQSQAASASLLGQATGRVALTDDWATAWRRHIYTEGLRAIPVGAPTSSILVDFWGLVLHHRPAQEVGLLRALGWVSEPLVNTVCLRVCVRVLLCSKRGTCIVGTLAKLLVPDSLAYLSRQALSTRQPAAGGAGAGGSQQAPPR